MFNETNSDEELKGSADPDPYQHDTGSETLYQSVKNIL